MPSTSAPFGLRPVKHASGNIRHEVGTIATGYASAIYKYSPVKMLSDGTIGVAAAGEAFVGAFLGCEYKDATGKPCRGYWPAAQTATDIVAYFTMDPEIIYEIQAEGTLTVNNIGNMADFDAAADDTGSTVTELSSAMMDTGVVGTTTAQLQIIGAAPGPHNAITDTYPILRVKIAEHQLRSAPTAGV